MYKFSELSMDKNILWKSVIHQNCCASWTGWNTQSALMQLIPCCYMTQRDKLAHYCLMKLCFRIFHSFTLFLASVKFIELLKEQKISFLILFDKKYV